MLLKSDTSIVGARETFPNFAAPKSAFDFSLGQMDITGDVDYDDLAVQLESYSGADITNLCRDAAMMSMRRAIKVRMILIQWKPDIKKLFVREKNYFMLIF